MQINLVSIAPYNETLINILFGIKLNGKIDIIRINPYPPSFSKTAARIIDPAIGASTWALGNHKCVENIGNFTKNPRIRNSHKIEKFIDGWIVNIEIIYNFLNFEAEMITRRIINIGNEAQIVYIIIYIPACIRSGW